jgi:FlaA1/EpsC-like NDP-sugar epimerase
MNINEILGRREVLFEKDLQVFNYELTAKIKTSSFLIIGGGGSIGQAVVKELFRRSAKTLHVVDINENYLAELVRDIRSDLGYLVSDFDTFALDCGESYFSDFIARNRYDYIVNLSAMKHVRSENDAFSMFRMLKTNIFNTLDTYEAAKQNGAKKYFCVSTDKAANPANFMGATKRAMELCLMRADVELPVSGARFANVAFSNGSLLEGFSHRLRKRQPLSLPLNIKRFFITPEESGIICMFSIIFGEHGDIMFPKQNEKLVLTPFKIIVENYLRTHGKKAIFTQNEQEARELLRTVDLEKFWPVNTFVSDTAGEKEFEEFHTSDEKVDVENFKDLASIKLETTIDEQQIRQLKLDCESVNLAASNSREQLLDILKNFVPSFEHVNKDKFLNERM